MLSNNKAKLRSILSELLKVKNISSKAGKLLIKQTQELIRKENLYLQIKTELDYHNNLNKQYKMYLALLRALTAEWKKSKNEIEYNTQKFKQEFKEFVSILEKYDNEIKNQNENKKQIISIGEEKIGIKNNEQKTLKKSLNDLEKKIKDQKDRIEFLQNENNRLKKQKDSDFSFYMQKMEDHEKKYNILNNKYINLKKQSDIFYNQNKEYLNPYLRMIKEATISNEIVENENKQIELNEKLMQHENLIEQVKEMSFRITQLSINSSMNTRNFSRFKKDFSKKNYMNLKKKTLKKSESTFF